MCIRDRDFNCGGNNQELLLHHCPVGINDWSHVSVGNETQYEAVMSRIQGLSIGIVIVTTILLFLRVVLVRTKYKSGPAFQKIENSEVVAVMSRNGDLSLIHIYDLQHGQRLYPKPDGEAQQ